MPLTSAKITIGRALLSASLLQSVFSSAPETIAQALKRHNVEISKGSLLEALHNSDKEVRGLAAAELYELKITDALPDIVRAAEAELDPLTQVNIASAATWMGSVEGLHILKIVCDNSAIPPYVRINAARNVFDKQDRSCFPALIELMSSTEPDARILALNLASQLQPKTEQETAQVLSFALQALQDKELRLRLEASQDLRWLRNPTAIEPLRKALEEEQETAVRSQMQSTLDFLIKHQTDPSTANQ
jgi:hypothetical protein